MEEWRPIVGFEGLYEVSNTGQVRNSVKGKLLSPGFDHNGYLKCVLSKKGKTKTIYIHRLVAQAFIPNPMCLKQVNHKDEDKSNNNVENLEWCDAKYNVNYGSAQEKRVKTNIINGKFKYTGHKKGEYHKEYYDENRDKINARRRKYYAEHKQEILEKNREYREKYYAEHMEEILEKSREYREKSRENNREYNRRWRENHPGYMKEKSKKWRENRKKMKDDD